MHCKCTVLASVQPSSSALECKILKETDEVEFQQCIVCSSNGDMGLRGALGAGRSEQSSFASARKQGEWSVR